MGNSIFIDNLIDNYYENIGNKNKILLKPGQIVRTYFFYNYENLEFWRPVELDKTSTQAAAFEICTSVKDQFNRSNPIYSPPLEVDEEFIVIRSKRRPAIIITPPPPKISVEQIRKGGKVNLNLCLLAPLFSLEDKDGNAKYSQQFVNRIRKLKYQHFFFLPAHNQRQIRNSLCRFDRIFSNYDAHLDPVDLCLCGEAFDIFFSQIKSYLTGSTEGSYKIAYETLNG
jgi:hypothetical protein